MPRQHDDTAPETADDAAPSVGADQARLEGMLLAHRYILSVLLARHADDALLDALLEDLDSRSVMHDHQEDPGAVPSEALAILGTEADEFRQIAERVRRLLDARQDNTR